LNKHEKLVHNDPAERGSFKPMKIITCSALAALALTLTSCATPKPQQAFQNTDKTALVFESLGNGASQMLLPAVSAKQSNDMTITEAATLKQHETAVVILENYTEPRLGSQFRNRCVSWFVDLRALGYKHIVFLQGNGNANPEGLLTLVEYN
jgi:hypothetical protein